MSRFLAEDFRKLMNEIDSITKGKSKKDKPGPDKPYNVDDLLKDTRPEHIEKDAIESIDDLIEYLDQFPELSNYRNENAKFDDAVYESIPLDVLSSTANLSTEDLNKIMNSLEPENAGIIIDDEMISIFGEDTTV